MAVQRDFYQKEYKSDLNSVTLEDFEKLKKQKINRCTCIYENFYFINKL